MASHLLTGNQCTQRSARSLSMPAAFCLEGYICALAAWHFCAALQADINAKCQQQLEAAAAGSKTPGGSNKRPRLSPSGSGPQQDPDGGPLIAEITQGQAQLLSWAEEKVNANVARLLQPCPRCAVGSGCVDAGFQCPPAASVSQRLTR